MMKQLLFLFLLFDIFYASAQEKLTYTYSFLHNSFCDTIYVDATGKTICRKTKESEPKFQIHEKSDIVLKIVDVNPFLYSVKQATLQTDQIDDKILSEKNWGKELRLDFKPIESLVIDQQLGLSELPSNKIAALIDSAKLISDILIGMDSFNELQGKLESKEISINDLNEKLTSETEIFQSNKKDLLAEIAGLNGKLKLSKSRLEQANSKVQSIKKNIDEKNKTTTANNEEKVKLEQLALDYNKATQKGDSLKTEIADLEQKLNTANVKRGVIEQRDLYTRLKEQLELEKLVVKKLEQQIASRKTLENQLRILNKQIREKNEPARKEGELLQTIKGLQQDALLLNKFISLHNNLITIVYLPTNDYRLISKKIDSLFVDILDIKKSEIDRYYNKLRDSVEIHTMQAYTTINELKRLHEPYKSNYDLIAVKISSFHDVLDKVDGSRLIRQIKFMIEMITEENFQLTPMKLYSYSDNVDLIRYHIELNPYSLPGDLPQGKTQDPLDFIVYLQGGIKFDVSSGFVLDLGLRDPSYYFERPTDSTAVVRQNGDGGNYNPSIALFLNGYRRSGSVFKLGGSFGTGISNNGRVRIYLGPSLLIGRSERVTISAGVALGAISRLANGYEVGQQIDNVTNLPAEVPTVLDKYKLGYYFGLGFNLTGERNRKLIENVKFN